MYPLFVLTVFGNVIKWGHWYPGFRLWMWVLKQARVDLLLPALFYSVCIMILPGPGCELGTFCMLDENDIAKSSWPGYKSLFSYYDH